MQLIQCTIFAHGTSTTQLLHCREGARRKGASACHASHKRPPLKPGFAMQEYVNKLAVMLLEARGNDHSAVQAQIDRLVNECSAICASLAMSNPSAIRTLHCSNFDGALMVQQGPSSSKWLSISVSSAQLSHSCYCDQADLSFGSLYM